MSCRYQWPRAVAGPVGWISWVWPWRMDRKSGPDMLSLRNLMIASRPLKL